VPWKETQAVDERRRFIEEWLRRETPTAELAALFGVSRKTAYKWVERYHQGGVAALVDGSRAPRTRPQAVSERTAQLIVELREKHRFWGPKKLKAWLEDHEPEIGWPAASTIGTLLKGRGLVEARRRRRRTPLSTQPLAAATESNIVWSADFKGQFKVAGRYCFPLTVTDNFSRYLLTVKGVDDERETTVKPLFDEAFREYGLPLRLRTDNGPPFASKAVGGLSRLSVGWVKLGITPERIEPGQPQQNGRHERMHRTLKAETAQPPMTTAAAQQASFDAFRRMYNDERPHEALQQKPPASAYLPSSRTMPPEPSDPDYPAEFAVRRLSKTGELAWGGASAYVGSVLMHEAVGIEDIDDGIAQLWFGPIYLGLLRQLGKKKIEFSENKG
jgi:putative transposase